MDARVLLERYRVEEKLGEGGMGVVHRGTDVRLGRQVAIKLLRNDVGTSAEAMRARFTREAKRTAQVRHAGIVEVFDVGETAEGDAFFVMELLIGEPLGARIWREGRIAPGAAVDLATQMCDALGAAHEAGIVHRDFKPANVMLVGPPGAVRVKVLDFGVAKHVGGNTQLTATGMLVGTVDYMAPEQIKGTVLDGRADIYSLGAVLYKMLTGSPVFDADNVAALIHSHLSVAPPRMRVRAPAADVPDALEAVVLRCLAKSPEGRFATTADVKRALVEALLGKAPDAAPKREPLPPQLPAGEREVDLELPSKEQPLELEEILRSAPPPPSRPRTPPPSASPTAPTVAERVPLARAPLVRLPDPIRDALLAPPKSVPWTIAACASAWLAATLVSGGGATGALLLGAVIAMMGVWLWLRSRV